MVIASPGSAEKRKCSPSSTIPTSRRSTASRTPAARTRSSWNSWKARRSRIASQGALPLDEALPIAKQIAEALESNPWDVHSIETVVAGGDGLQEVVGDKATALK
jgi:hypothetical protein